MKRADVPFSTPPSGPVLLELGKAGVIGHTAGYSGVFTAFLPFMQATRQEGADYHLSPGA